MKMLFVEMVTTPIVPRLAGRDLFNALRSCFVTTSAKVSLAACLRTHLV